MLNPKGKPLPVSKLPVPSNKRPVPIKQDAALNKPKVIPSISQQYASATVPATPQHKPTPLDFTTPVNQQQRARYDQLKSN